MTQRRNHSEETKAHVLAALMEGQSVAKVARDYDLPRGTIDAWKSRTHASETPLLQEENRYELGALLLEYMREDLRTLLAQNVVLRDPEWLREQDAASLATLRGVTVDKVVRLLESMAKAEAPTDGVPHA